MALLTTILIIAVIVILLLVFVEMRKLKHQFIALIILFVLIFSYFGYVVAIKDKNINFKTFEGLKTATKLYFAWLGKVFENTKTITGNVIRMDWKAENDTKKNKN